MQIVGVKHMQMVGDTEAKLSMGSTKVVPLLNTRTNLASSSTINCSLVELACTP